jgi:hypothetical protein
MQVCSESVPSSGVNVKGEVDVDLGKQDVKWCDANVLGLLSIAVHRLRYFNDDWRLWR